MDDRIVSSRLSALQAIEVMPDLEPALKQL
jgi:hypothetical protein